MVLRKKVKENELDFCSGIALDSDGIYEECKRYIFKNLKYILDFICSVSTDMRRRGKTWRIAVFDKEIVVVIDLRKRSGVRFVIGFPFPIHDMGIECDPAFDFSVLCCIRGPLVRSIHRRILCSVLGNCTTNLDISVFRQEVMQITRNANRLIYFNPYEFLGDTVIGMYFAKRIRIAYRIPYCLIFSRFHDHISFVENTKDIEMFHISALKCNDVILMPDLIDSHLEHTIKRIGLLENTEHPILCIGRNVMRNKEKKTVFVMNENDHILRNENIEDYMDKVLAPFLPPNSLYNAKPYICRTVSGSPIRKKGNALPPLFESDTTTAMINPFAREESRFLPYDVIQKILKTLTESFSTNRIIIPDYAPTQSHRRLKSRIVEGLRAEGMDPVVSWVTFDSLSDLIKFLKSHRIRLVFSPDTSVPHYLIEAGIPALTIFLDSTWDDESIQNLASSSPLGFCRYNSIQHPILCRTKLKNWEPDLFLKILEFFIGKSFNLEKIRAVFAFLTFDVERISSIEEENLFCYVEEMIDRIDVAAESQNAQVLIEMFDFKYFFSCLRRHPPGEARKLLYSMFKISSLYKICS